MAPRIPSVSEKARKILLKLLNKGELRIDRSRDVTLPASRIQDYPFEDARDSRDFHTFMELAADAGPIALEWKRHYEGVELLRVRLLDPSALASFLKRDFLPDRVANIFSDIDTSSAPTWVCDALEQLRQKWLTGKSMYGLSVDDADKLHDIVTTVTALDNLPADVTFDYRQFGARYLGNSKRTRELAAPLAALFREKLNLQGMKEKDILRQLNLVPLSHPVLIHGPLQLTDGRKLITTDIQPYIGVPSAFLAKFNYIRLARYVLSIENLSSFNEYTENIHDGGVVIYTGGFPTRSLQMFYQRLVSTASTPVYHWGDTDPYGFLILKKLQEVAGDITSISVMPHLMDATGGDVYSYSQLSALKRLLPINPHVDALIRTLIEKRTGLVEQELISASSPLHSHDIRCQS